MAKKKKNPSLVLTTTQRIFLVLGFIAIGVLTYIISQLLSVPHRAQAEVLPVGQVNGWKLVFSDEFDDAVLNGAKWTTCYPWSGDDDRCAHSQELEWYMPANVSIGNGVASLSAKSQHVVGSNGKSYSYTSGMITTGINKWDTALPARFAFTYGFMEIRTKVPRGQGLWPAFWLLPFSSQDPGKWPPEIDAMEILGNDPTTVHMHFHYKDSQGVDRDSGGSYTGPDFSAGYHTYGVSWEKDAIRWYVDGVEARPAFTEGQFIPAEPMYILANMAVGGSWPGAPDATTDFPATMDIDYIRVWQKPVVTAAVTPPVSTPLPTATKMPTPTPKDITPPIVSIYQPVNNAIVPRGRQISIYASASDTSGIQRVEFFVDGLRKCADATPSPYSCTWSVPNARSRVYKLTAKAYDAKGNMGSSSQIIVTAK